MDMVDSLSREQRSERMARIRSVNTKPELLVRKLLYGLGYRYRVAKTGLPGRPDIVFTAKKKVIFVHGCFWHQHSGCKVSHIPKTRSNFWEQKFSANVIRDKRNEAQLEGMDWKVLVIWECELRDVTSLLERLTHFLGKPPNG